MKVTANILANSVDINFLMFKIKNYVSNYQELLKVKKYSINVDWEKYIDYGTTDLETIEIQNLGFTRNMAIFLKDNKNHTYEFDEELLKEKIDKLNHGDEYEEISKFLDWENTEE